MSGAASSSGTGTASVQQRAIPHQCFTAELAAMLASIEKNPHQDIAPKLHDIQQHLETLRKQIDQLPGGDTNLERQLHQIAVAEVQLQKKTELIQKYQRLGTEVLNRPLTFSSGSAGLNSQESSE